MLVGCDRVGSYINPQFVFIYLGCNLYVHMQYAIITKYSKVLHEKFQTLVKIKDNINISSCSV